MMGIAFSNDVGCESCLLRREDNDVLVVDFTANLMICFTEIIQLLKLLFGSFLQIPKNLPSDNKYNSGLCYLSQNLLNLLQQCNATSVIIVCCRNN